MSRKEGPLMDLFRPWAENQLIELKPEVQYASADEISEFNAEVRKVMAAELLRVRKLVDVQRRNRALGTVEVVTMRAGMQELHQLRWHKAFQRIDACARCVESAKRYNRKAPISCRHRTPMQHFVHRMYNVLSAKPNTRTLMYVLLVLREAIEHFNFYGFNPVVAKEFVDSREREPARPTFTIERMLWKDDDTADVSSVEYVEVRPTDSTSRLYADLQGWDRPTSFSKKTQRLAFCGRCAALGEYPWFWVARRRVEGGYERAPFPLTAVCPCCKSVETTPDLPPRTPIQFVTRKYRRHGVVGHTHHVFYRSRGRWVAASTHEVCSTELNFRLQRRWRLGQ